jgi:hypothetical protein
MRTEAGYTSRCRGYQMRMASEVDLTRAINALAVTLNDQKLDHFDADRVQEVVTGATNGEQVLIAYGSGTSGELRDGSIEGPAVAKLQLDRGEWSVQRVPEARKSQKLQQFEQQRSKQKETEYQKPVRGRLAVWKKKVSGG